MNCEVNIWMLWEKLEEQRVMMLMAAASLLGAKEQISTAEIMLRHRGDEEELLRLAADVPVQSQVQS